MVVVVCVAETDSGIHLVFVPKMGVGYSRSVPYLLCLDIVAEGVNLAGSIHVRKLCRSVIGIVSGLYGNDIRIASGIRLPPHSKGRGKWERYADFSRK